MKYICYLIMLSISALQATENLLIPQNVTNDWIKTYSEEEKKIIHEDAARIHSIIFSPNVLNTFEKHYLATAGGPGSGKSTILETFLASNPTYKSYAYIDPDQRTLRFMIATYVQSLNLSAISKAPSYQTLLEENYTKWRGGSNYIANTFLNEAVSKGYSIAHGTTSTSTVMAKFYDKLMKAGYDITLLLCFSPFDNCKKSIEHRAHTQAFIQSTGDDTRQKYNQFFKTLPIYIKHAQILHFYWTQSFEKGAVYAGSFSCEKGLVIRDEKAMESIKNLYKEQQGHDGDLMSFDQLFSAKKNSED